MEELSEALSPANNQKQIIEDSKNNGEGGRSGEFFFFNYNNTLILKTIRIDEREVYLQRLQAFHQHYKDHPHSLIVKMLTVFTALNTDTNEEINFILMGNILRRVSK
jgi:1-phosphatidylinositol-4-phosphate 5-kinase